MKALIDVAAEETTWERLETLFGIGVVPHVGMWRRPYTAAEDAVNALAGEWMQQAGMAVRRDAFGNLIGRIDGIAAGAAVMTGSHLDTVKNGGRFDGALGVVAGIEAVAALVQRFGPPERPLEVVSFVGEEGSRFPGGLLGSKAMMGLLGRSDLAQVDDDGISLATAMRDAELDPGQLDAARRDDIHAFLELHPEQGRVLETDGAAAGIVTAIVGMHQVAVRVTGRADHAGTTPIPMRLDPLPGVARMILAMTERVSDAGAVVTVGRVQALPGATNIVPAEVTFTIDFRMEDPGERAALFGWLEATCRSIAAEHGLGIAWRVFHEQAPIAMHPLVTSALAAAATELGIPALHMPSGAGHDAMVVATRFPTGMLFAPSKDGRSHAPEEWTSPEDVSRAVALLAHALGRLAYPSVDWPATSGSGTP